MSVCTIKLEIIDNIFNAIRAAIRLLVEVFQPFLLWKLHCWTTTARHYFYIFIGTSPSSCCFML